MKLKIIIIVLIMVIPILGCDKDYLSSVPNDLQGVWIASEGRYAGCSLILSADLIVFGSRSGDLESNYIKRISENKELNAIQYTIIYKNKENQEYEMRIKYNTTQKMIMLENDTETKWFKES